MAWQVRLDGDVHQSLEQSILTTAGRILITFGIYSEPPENGLYSAILALKIPLDQHFNPFIQLSTISFYTHVSARSSKTFTAIVSLMSKNDSICCPQRMISDPQRQAKISTTTLYTRTLS